MAMKASTRIAEPAFGHFINYRFYEPVKPSKNFVIFLHGQGERGPADGSMIHLVEKWGIPLHIKNGHEFDFNVIAPQVVGSYSQLVKFILPWVKLHFKAERIVTAGLSMGGIGTYELIARDEFNFIDGALIACGKYTGPAENIPKLPEKDIMHFHGDKDTTSPVQYAPSKAMVEAYNASHTKQIDFITLPGVAHNAWGRTFSIAPGEDQGIQFINKIFARPLTNEVGVIKQKLLDLANSLPG